MMPPQEEETMAEEEQEEDADDVMILRSVPKPPLEECRGYWVEVDEDQLSGGRGGEDFVREGLIEGVDIATKLLIVDFGNRDSPEEYEVEYDSEHIKQWFLMTSRREQDRIVRAALRIQLWAKRRLLLRGTRSRGEGRGEGEGGEYAHLQLMTSLSAINSSQSFSLSQSPSQSQFQSESPEGTFSVPTTPVTVNTGKRREQEEEKTPQLQLHTQQPQRHPQTQSTQQQQRRQSSPQDETPITLQVETEIETVAKGETEKEEIESTMILRPVPRPSLSKAMGYWICLSDTPHRDREALVDQVDLEKRLIRAEFLDTEEESPDRTVLVSYDDPSLVWYRMSSKREEEAEKNAAIRIQTLVRGRYCISSSLLLFCPALISVNRLARAKVKLISAKVKTKEEAKDKEKDKVSLELPLSERNEENDDHQVDSASAAALAANPAANSPPLALSLPLSESTADPQDHPQAPPQESLPALSLSQAPTPTDLNLDEMELQAMDHPPSLFNCPGHWIIRSSDPEREGLIESVDLETQVMEVIYEEEGQGERQVFSRVEVLYSEPNLQWYEESHLATAASAVSTSRSAAASVVSSAGGVLFSQRSKPPYDRVVGCYILLPEDSPSSPAPVGDAPEVAASVTPPLSADLALVVDATQAGGGGKKMLKVQFVQKISRDGRVVCDEEIEEVPYATKSVVWLTGKL
jgi:hypothetical protein